MPSRLSSSSSNSRPHRAEELAPCLSQRDPPRTPLEQSDAEFLLQRCQAAGDSRQREVQDLRSAGQAPSLGHSDEGVELVEIDRHGVSRFLARGTTILLIFALQQALLLL